jgi:hypothetical protein
VRAAFLASLRSFLSTADDIGGGARCLLRFCDFESRIEISIRLCGATGIIWSHCCAMWVCVCACTASYGVQLSAAGCVVAMHTPVHVSWDDE